MILKINKKLEFKWDYCGFCEAPYVICPFCGNNSCNCAYGKVKNGEPTKEFNDEDENCPICDLMNQYEKVATPPEFDEKYRQSKKFKQENFFKELGIREISKDLKWI